MSQLASAQKDGPAFRKKPVLFCFPGLSAFQREILFPPLQKTNSVILLSRVLQLKYHFRSERTTENVNAVWRRNIRFQNKNIDTSQIIWLQSVLTFTLLTSRLFALSGKLIASVIVASRLSDLISALCITRLDRLDGLDVFFVE